jgi:DNA-binding IclR family transcriptional regulator
MTVINSVLKAIRIMEFFTPEHPARALSDISKELGLPKSTVHNLLNTLMAAGYIEKTDGNLYALGTAVIALTQNVRVNVEIRDRAAPLLRELADLCKESVYLTIREDDCALYIYAIESSHRLIARTAVGDRTHLHCTAVGKSILANLPDSDVDQIIARVGLPRFTDATITSPDHLKAQLHEIREQGYSLDRQEHEKGVFCIGAPIFDVSGTVFGACSVSGIDSEIVKSRARALSGAITRVARDISQRMGYVPSSITLVH